MKVRVYKDYNPIRILRGVVETTDALAEKMGLTGAYEEIEESAIPKSRKNRNEWGIKNGKIEVNQEKLTEKQAIESAKTGRKTKVVNALKTLGLTEDDIKESFGI